MKYIVENGAIRTDQPLDFKAILSCGQTFRFKETEGGYEVFSGENRCLCSGDRIVTDTPEYFASYFDLDTDYDEYMSTLIGFEELVPYIGVGKGIRILRQNLYEMIISFIISANNNIPRIKGIIERLCAFCGADKGGYYAFPSPERLVKVKKEEFRMLGAGYRDSYLRAASRLLYESDILCKLVSESTIEARKTLLTIPGVGPKVADCILLFGLRRFDCFPVDTWIFGKCGSDELNTKKKVHDFYLSRYGSLAGLAQQYIFYGAREQEK